MSSSRLAVLTCDSSHSRLIRVPASFSDLLSHLERILGVKKYQVKVLHVKDQTHPAELTDEASFQAACATQIETLTLQVNTTDESKSKKSAGNYVLTFTAKQQIRVLNLDDDSVTHWESKRLHWTGRVCVLSDHELIFTGGSAAPNTAYLYDLRTGKETQLTNMLKGRIWHGLATLEGAVYAVGGRESAQSHPTNSSEVLRAGSWSELPGLNTPRESMTLLAHQSALYAFGGFDGSQRLSTIEKLAGAEWVNLTTEFPVARQMPGVLFTGVDTVLVVGGQDSNSERTDVFEVNFSTGETRSLQELPSPDYFTGRQLVHRSPDLIWAFGHQTLILNLKTSQWTPPS